MSGPTIRSKASEVNPPSPLLGQGVLIIWNAVAPDDNGEFNHWYTHEHLPERLGIPGFLRGRRYAASEDLATGLLHYMTLYETDDLSVLSSTPYLDRLNNPTDLTLRVLPALRQVVRGACSAVISGGQGIGGHLGCIPFAFDEAVMSDEVRGWLAGPGVSQLLEDPDILSVHYFVTDVGVTALKDQTREQAAGSAAAGVHSLLAIEATRNRGVMSASMILSDAISVRKGGSSSEIRLQSFELMVCMESHSK